MVTLIARRAAVGALTGVCLALGAGATGLAAAQEAYPTRPIEFIVPWGPGGGADQQEKDEKTFHSAASVAMIAVRRSASDQPPPSALNRST